MSSKYEIPEDAEPYEFVKEVVPVESEDPDEPKGTVTITGTSTVIVDDPLKRITSTADSERAYYAGGFEAPGIATVAAFDGLRDPKPELNTVHVSPEQKREIEKIVEARDLLVRSGGMATSPPTAQPQRVPHSARRKLRERTFREMVIPLLRSAPTLHTQPKAAEVLREEDHRKLRNAKKRERRARKGK